MGQCPPRGPRGLGGCGALGDVLRLHQGKLGGVGVDHVGHSPLFVGLIEPVVFKRSVAWREMAVAAVVFVGIALVFQAERDQTEGILLGLVSAALAALFSTVNGVLVKQHDPIQLSAVELLAASVGMACWLALQGEFDLSLIQLSGSDWLWIVLLAVVATSFAFMVSIQVLQQLTPFESAMAINLEPIYAIVLAYFLFDERFSSGFYLGAVLVIGAVFVDTMLRATRREIGTPPRDAPVIHCASGTRNRPLSRATKLPRSRAWDQARASTTSGRKPYALCRESGQIPWAVRNPVMMASL